VKDKRFFPLAKSLERGSGGEVELIEEDV